MSLRTSPQTGVAISCMKTLNLKEENTMTVKSKSEKLGQGVGFERIRRITGYLVGTMDKWNDAKRAEERDRVKHGLNGNA